MLNETHVQEVRTLCNLWLRDRDNDPGSFIKKLKDKLAAMLTEAAKGPAKTPEEKTHDL